MKLAEWLVLKGKSQAEFSRDMEVTQPCVHFWVNGIQPPSSINMMRIYRLTNGKVGLKDWCEEFDGQI